MVETHQPVLSKTDRCSPDFEPLLAHFDREALASHSGTVIGVNAEYKICYLNPSWDEFSAENGGEPKIGDAWGLGAEYLSAVPTPVREFYEQLFQRAEGESSSRRPVQHEYECSSPVVFRKFQMNVYGLVGCSSLLIVNSLVVECPHRPDLDVAGSRIALGDYVDGSGLVKQCCHCRRIQCPKDTERWVWIRDWVDKAPENTSHSLCRICYHSYYSDIALAP